jgi:DNA-binding transcriptional regulator of glucitol operon
VLVIGFLLLGWWQIDRARDGNALSFGYAVEWPVFAAFAVWVWVKEIRAYLRTTAPATEDEPAPKPRPVIRATVQRSTTAYDDSGDADLEAYNHYLAWLNANPHASRSQYPGRT